MAQAALLPVQVQLLVVIFQMLIMDSVTDTWLKLLVPVYVSL